MTFQVCCFWVFVCDNSRPKVPGPMPGFSAVPTTQRDSIMNSERTWMAGSAIASGFEARALNPSPAFWLAMFAASAFGTVLGDFWAEGLHLGRVLSCGAPGV